MLRGRRVGILMAFMLIPGLLRPIDGSSIKRIAQGSSYTLDTSTYRNLAVLEMKVADTSDSPSLIQAYLIEEGRLAGFEEKEADRDGNVVFTFVRKKDLSYEAIIINNSYMQPFAMRCLKF